MYGNSPLCLHTTSSAITPSRASGTADHVRSSPDSLVTFSSTAPAHPHATRVAVYPALFWLTLPCAHNSFFSALRQILVARQFKISHFPFYFGLTVCQLFWLNLWRTLCRRSPPQTGPGKEVIQISLSIFFCIFDLRK